MYGSIHVTAQLIEADNQIAVNPDFFTVLPAKAWVAKMNCLIADSKLNKNQTVLVEFMKSQPCHWLYKYLVYAFIGPKIRRNKFFFIKRELLYLWLKYCLATNGYNDDAEFCVCGY